MYYSGMFESASFILPREVFKVEDIDSKLKLDAELKFLKDVLQKNGFPLNFIEYSIGKMLKKLYCCEIDK